ncbi:MAG: GGDEF domain-containing protein [Deltaproteobacteria bacterium]|jgi:diguanylate cyclase (GGDEF)-like protein|nr:GGDEF domain-containing protein [Deltaproteobacteria bacterium]
MNRIAEPCNIWSFGLSGMAEAELRKLIDGKFVLRAWPAEALPGIRELELDQPCLNIFSVAGHKAYKKHPVNKSGHLDFIQHALMLDFAPSATDVEYACDTDCCAIIRAGIDQKTFLRKIDNALEIEAAQHEALRMSREIYLEREILERKNEVLQFLVSFLTKTAAGLDPEEIIRTAFSSLKLLFPVRSMHAALWRPGENEHSAEMYITADAGGKSAEKWRRLMLEHLEQALPEARFHLRSYNMPLHDQEKKWRNASPESGHVFSLPIAIAGAQIGVICILTDMDRSLSRDQAQALNSALQFLALSLNNAQHFQNVKQQADYDALTSLFSRRHFEERLVIEADRANHQQHALSMIFCDLDHFKNVNDTQGHQAGDEVLRSVAGVIRSIIRERDYAARYGGEEFVVLLPYTEPKQAAALAERLRLAVESETFATGQGPVRLTISLGVSGSQADEEKDGSKLLQEADQALYQAKRDNRNCVREFAALPQMKKVVG